MLVHNRLISRANGPARRAVIWVQGCTGMNCKGCWNPLTHTHDKPDNSTPEKEAEWILSQADIEGVTFSGGEPMQQGADILTIMNLVKTKRSELTFGMFTGYNLSELDAGRFKYRRSYNLGTTPDAWVTDFGDDALTASVIWTHIKSMLDFAVMGRFQEAHKTSGDPMRSSTNQRLEFFTDRYQESDFKKQTVELVIYPGGRHTLTGFPVGVKL